MGSYRDEQVGDSSMIPQNQSSPPLTYYNRHVIYRNQEAEAANEASSRGTIHSRARSTVRTHGWKMMRILQPDTGLTVESDVDMADVANEKEGVEIPASSSATDVHGEDALVLEASKKFVTIYDVRFIEVVAGYEKKAGDSLEGKFDVFLY